MGFNSGFKGLNNLNDPVLNVLRLQNYKILCFTVLVAVLWLSDGHVVRRPFFDPRLVLVSFVVHKVAPGEISRPSPASFHK